jgi:hypothetical protein
MLQDGCDRAMMTLSLELDEKWGSEMTRRHVK